MTSRLADVKPFPKAILANSQIDNNGINLGEIWIKICKVLIYEKTF